MSTIAEFIWDSDIIRFCSGIGISKKILAPEIEMPSLTGVVKTFSVIEKATGKIIIKMYIMSITLNLKLVFKDITSLEISLF